MHRKHLSRRQSSACVVIEFLVAVELESVIACSIVVH